MSTEIRLRRGIAAQWTSANPVLGPGEAGYETDTGKLKIGDGVTAWSSLSYFIGNLPGGTLNDLGDVTITSAANGDFLRWNGSAWINDAVNLSTDTVGDYVNTVTASTGVTITGAGGESSSPTFSIGQDVAPSASVTFAHISGPVAGNATTASALQNARTISLSGDISGSISFDGSQNVDISATVQPNSVALGTDTTGNYVNNVVSGTGVTVTHTPGEGSSASIAIGQDVATTASVAFAQVTAPLNGNANTASTLQNARTISLSGDVSGSVSFNGSQNVDISTTVQPNSVALGTDTTGNYVNDVVAGTGVTVSHTPGEGSSASIAIGQDVATSASVQFGQITTTGDITVGGNLTVNGTTTTLNTETLAVEDNIVLLNSNVTGAPSTNAGIEVERGDSANVVLRWNESTDSWEVTEDGSTYKNIAVGQDVETTSSVSFAAVTAPLIGNASTATTLQNARTIAISGDVSGSVSFDGSQNVDITATIQPNSVALGTDTTGNYVNDVVAGTGITISHTPGEGSSASVSIGQNVATTSSVTFATVTATLIGNADTASQLQTARAISLAGDLSGSVSFSGSADVVLTASVVNSGVSLDEVSDVVITSPEEFQSLTYNGSSWVNNYAPTVTYVRNAEATTLTTGTVVYLFGATGDHASVKRADNDSDTTSSKTIGLVAANIASSENGPVVTRGYVDGINLSAGYTAGDILWLAEDGGFTTTKPSAPEHLVFIGVVVRATENGIIYVATQNGYELEELHDVKITSATNNDFLKYNSASGVWVNDQINLGTDTTGNYVSDVVQGSGILVTHTPGEGSSASIALNAGLNELSDVSVIDSTEGQLLIRTAEGWQNVTASGDVTVNASGVFSIAANSVALGTDTTGNYMTDVYGGTGVTINHTAGEGSTASISIGQDVATTASVTFAKVTASAVSILSTPSNNSDAATKAYVDQVTAGINWHESVKYATTATLPNNPAYNHGSVDQNNGTGIGTTITAGTYGRLSIDGANVSTGQRVLVKNQLDAEDNGVYVVTEQGSASVYWILTRASDSNNSIADQVKTGDAVYVVDGAVNANQGFIINSAGSQPNNVIRIGTDEITWTQFTGTASFIAGNGLSTTGNTINVNTESSSRIVVNSDNIDLATVSQTNTTGSDGITFVQSHTVDSYGRITGTVNASVQNASTSQKGIAQFDSAQFSVASGSVSIANNGITLGTHTTGNYVSGVIGTGGITVSHTPGEGSTASISLDSVITSNSAGSSGTNFVSAVTVNGSGQVTAVTSSDVQDASTSAKGIARFNSSQFTVSSGSVSLAGNAVQLGENTYGSYVTLINGTTDQINVSGSGGENASVTLSLPQSIATSSSPTFNALTLNGSASVGTNASISSALFVANGKIVAQESASQQMVSLRPHVAGIPYEALRIASTYNISTSNTSTYVQGINFSGAVVAGMQITSSQSTSTFSPAIVVGPRILVSASYASDLSSALTSDISSSVHLGVQRTTNSSVAMSLYDQYASSTTNMFEVFDSTQSVKLSIGHSNNNYMFSAGSASLATASIGTASVSGVSYFRDDVLIQSVSASVNKKITVVGRVAAGTDTVDTQATLTIKSLSDSLKGIVVKAYSSNPTGNLQEWQDSNGGPLAYIGPTGSLTLAGNLTVNGTTTTVNSTTVTIDDPIFTLGGDTAPSSDDNKDRGIEFRYHSGTAASVGFMGYDDSTGRFIYLTGATNTSEVFSGTNASVQVGSLQVVGATGSRDGVSIGYDGSTASISFTSIGNDFVEMIANASFRGLRFYAMGGSNSGSMSYSGVDNTFSFSRAIASASLSSASLSSASLQSASLGAPMLSGSVQFDTSASVTLPSKTFFPEEYLSVSSSVTLNSTTHRYATLEMTASTGTSVITVPADASDNFAVGSVIQIVRVGAGEVQVTASAGVTVNNALGSRLRAQWSTATLRKRAANTWLLSGDLKV